MHMGIMPSPILSITEAHVIDNKTRVLLLAIRQALLMALGALEDYLNLERSIIPKHRKAK